MPVIAVRVSRRAISDVVMAKGRMLRSGVLFKERSFEVRFLNLKVQPRQ